MTRFEEFKKVAYAQAFACGALKDWDGQILAVRHVTMAIETLMLPDEEKIIGKKYIERCGHLHVWNGPPKSAKELENTISSKHAVDIAREIDEEIYLELTKDL